MKLLPSGLVRFDRHLPVYNWLYPLHGSPRAIAEDAQAVARFLDALPTGPVRSRALYLHVPFCTSTCTFCPFVRTEEWSPEFVEAYVDALVREVRLKARHASLAQTPVRAVYVGGGTPSVLSPDQIRRVGAALHEYFDLTDLREFSLEMAATSVTPERMAAALDIGVTHARMGVQTFDPLYRRLFHLRSTMDQVVRGVDRLLSGGFRYVCIDMLYGMHGQTPDQLLRDIHHAVDLGTPLIDYYPINHVVSRPALYEGYAAHGLAPTSGLTKLAMNVLVRETMRQSGLVPHNGHGYVRVDAQELARDPVVTDRYSFVYHEHCYGGDAEDVLGFGVSAVSSLHGFRLTNGPDIEGYTRSLQTGDTWPFTATEHPPEVDAARGVVVRLPYHGVLPCDSVRWEAVHPHTLRALDDLKAANLVEEVDGRLRLSRAGWYWYVNLIYYLSPPEEQRILDAYIRQKRADPTLAIEAGETAIEPLRPVTAVDPPHTVVAGTP
ncbi:MAG: radical SAM protein [Armatimonadetes bacterium]|nr:radical SAM protein [Armatimonadota bacterium]